LPGVKPPASIESDEASRPTFEEECGRLAASATEGEARFVGSCETDDTASPQEGQKRAEPGTSEEQVGQRITASRFYGPLPPRRRERAEYAEIY
jgi:hypothetical protein